MGKREVDKSEGTCLGGEVLKRGSLHNVDRKRVVGVDSRKTTRDWNIVIWLFLREGK